MEATDPVGVFRCNFRLASGESPGIELPKKESTGGRAKIEIKLIIQSNIIY